jgi:CheY-like chemotaxis protein
LFEVVRPSLFRGRPLNAGARGPRVGPLNFGTVGRVPADVVAIINTSRDAADMLSALLESAGFVTVSGYTVDIRDGRLDLASFVRQHQPKVIVYDIAPPYERNWRMFEHLRTTILKDYRFVLTSTNVAQVEQLIGRTPRIYEVVGKPFDLDAIGALLWSSIATSCTKPSKTTDPGCLRTAP